MNEAELKEYEARARKLVTPCEGGERYDSCRNNATKRCCSAECRIERCDEHAIGYSGYCDHEWEPIEAMAREVLELAAEVRRQNEVSQSYQEEPPTDDQIVSLYAEGGSIIYGYGLRFYNFIDNVEGALGEAKAQRDGLTFGSWMPLDSKRRQRAWPKTSGQK